MNRKYFDLSLCYAGAAAASGVFYREFTKYCDFSGVTSLAKVHTHLFILGMFVFLLLALFTRTQALEKNKTFRIFLYVYNFGLSSLALSMTMRGIIQVTRCTISQQLSVVLTGFAGISHVLVGAGLVLLLLSLRNASTEAFSEKQDVHGIAPCLAKSLGVLYVQIFFARRKRWRKIISSFACLKNSLICLIQVVSGNMSEALFTQYSLNVGLDTFLLSKMAHTPRTRSLGVNINDLIYEV